MAPQFNDSYWVLTPTKGVSVVFAVLFFISGVYHAVQNTHFRVWAMNFMFPVGIFALAASFAVREAGAYHPANLGLYVSSNTLLSTAVPLCSFAIYYVLARTLYYVPHASPYNPRWVAGIYWIVSIIAIPVSANGASHYCNREAGHGELLAGDILTKTSLFLQLAMFAVFVHILVAFQRGCRHLDLYLDGVRTVVMALYVYASLIIVRTIYAIYQAFRGYGYKKTGAEWYFWVFEALPLLIAVILLNVAPPGKHLPSDFRKYLDMDGRTEIVGPGCLSTSRDKAWEDALALQGMRRRVETASD